MSFYCPVCKTADPPNELWGNINCSHCNTDLKQYLLLYSSGKNKIQVEYLYLGLIAIITLAFTFVYFSRGKNTTHYIASVHSYTTPHIISVSNANGTDQGTVVTQKPPEITQPVIVSKHVVSENTNIAVSDCRLLYKVKNGDCITRIARLYYNDYYKYKKIEEDNKLVRPYKLHPGQMLVINLGK